MSFAMAGGSSAAYLLKMRRQPKGGSSQRAVAGTREVAGKVDEIHQLKCVSIEAISDIFIFSIEIIKSLMAEADRVEQPAETIRLRWL